MNKQMRNAEGYLDPTASIALLNVKREERAAKPAYMPLVYICSPYAGEVEINAQNARRYCAFAVSQKALPIAPHLLFPQFMDDDRPESRELALHMGLILVSHCREVWYFGDTISAGMKREIGKARWRGMIVRHFNDDCTEVQK